MMDASHFTFSGAMSIAGEAIVGGGEPIHAVDPATGARLAPAYGTAELDDVASACASAAAAAGPYRRAPIAERARFLDRIAARLEERGDDLVDRVVRETAIPRPRVVGELGRTTGQLRYIAELVRSGEWRDVRVDDALPDRVPPRPRIARRNVPVGPVAVFGASNFPLAFSVAGGDTASALGAGCPVVVKGHSGHPGTAELVAASIAAAAADAGMPPGVFSLLFGPGHTVGTALVADPRIAAVGFTGSFAGGAALARVAAARPSPIPVFAEMSSVNPVFLLEGALAQDPGALAADYVASLTLSSGQLCTNPGLVVAVQSPALDRFLEAVAREVADREPATMLSPTIARSYGEGVAARRSVASVIAEGRSAVTTPVVFRATSAQWRANPSLTEEIFGAQSLVVECVDIDDLHDLARGLDGQLTASVHLGPAETDVARALLDELETKAGRLVVGGWPTGVEVVSSMVHGGPHPATTDSRFSAVGELALRRFLRPVAYQGWPDGLLPAELR
jgi:alpha-ketoglutaric semialdehyde dehydrogenase